MHIISTVGPNLLNNCSIDNFILEGTTGFRFNLSHGNIDKVKEQITYIKDNYEGILTMIDLQGSKLRVSRLYNKVEKAEKDHIIYFCSEEFYKSENKKDNLLPIYVPGGFKRLSYTKYISMKDGTMNFKVLEFEEGKFFKTKCLDGGIIRKEKGVNISSMNREGIGLTLMDKNNLREVLKAEPDIILMSYTNSRNIIVELREYLRDIPYKSTLIWSKVECNEGIKNIEEIIKISDGVVIGRGDLVAEIDIKNIPLIEDNIISISKKHNKDIIIATYILSSMKSSIKPNLNEVECIYNFIIKRVTGFMMTSEVSVGKYPLDSIRTLKFLIKNTLDKS
ncbi:pyruvate kinase [Clostridium hydrogeniformans]|uniref:pyruvate kinase n=1 Tax=Clostridium hydrogeniformans TaxID=349933 RepID=UPI000486F7E5|nr:pyruvate kinase [Clostridium hydrogeniformans]